MLGNLLSDRLTKSGLTEGAAMRDGRSAFSCSRCLAGAGQALLDLEGPLIYPD